MGLLDPLQSGSIEKAFSLITPLSVVGTSFLQYGDKGMDQKLGNQRTRPLGNRTSFVVRVNSLTWVNRALLVPTLGLHLSREAFILVWFLLT